MRCLGAVADVYEVLVRIRKRSEEQEQWYSKGRMKNRGA